MSDVESTARSGGLHTSSTRTSRPDLGQVAIVAAAYLASWGGLLLSADGIYWDDWTVFDATLEETWSAASEAGLVWGFVLGLLSRGGPVMISALTFAGFLVSSVLVLTLLSRISFLTRSEATFGSAVFAAAPLMAARQSAVLVMYVLALTSVLGLWALLTRPGRARGRTLLAALPLILLSALIPSAGLFVLVPVGHAVVLRRHELRDPLRLTVLVLAVSLPALQLVASRELLPARGSYEGYNAISLRPLGLMIVLTGAAAAVSALLVAVLRHRRSGPEFGFAIVAIGITLGLVALTPYVAVGHEPPYEDWATRHELMLPIGAAVVAVGAARLLAVFGSRRLVLATMVGATLVLVSQSAAVSLAYLRDWEKQEALILLLREEDAIRLADVVQFTDGTREQNVFGRNYRVYEWNGLMVRAFGDSRRATVPSLEAIPALLSRDDRTAEGRAALYDGSRDFNPTRANTLARVTVAVDPDALAGVTLTAVLEPLPGDRVG